MVVVGQEAIHRNVEHQCHYEHCTLLLVQRRLVVGTNSHSDLGLDLDVPGILLDIHRPKLEPGCKDPDPDRC